jgi:segregation and condensation protein A
MKGFVIEEEHPFALLVPLIREGKLDPWNVDIVQLANLYVEEIKRREILDLRVPARAILAASFLLRKKVEVLFPKPERRVNRKKGFTLQELVDMFEQEGEEIKEEIAQNLDKLQKVVRSRRKGYRRKSKGRKIPLHISRFEDVLESMWEFFKGLEVGRRLEFINFLDKKNFVPQFMALMYLYFEGKIELYQEKPYGDLLIEILEVKDAT